MDNIKLLRKIERKIEEAESYLPEILEAFQGLRPIYRIKDKKRILEKIQLRLNNPRFQGMDEVEILDTIGDIIGLTIVRENIENVPTTSDFILEQIEAEKLPIEPIAFVDHIKDKGPTNYKCELLVFEYKGEIKFEIQITDKENLAIREATHEEFEKIKYGKIRNSVNEPKRIDDISK